MNKMKKHILIIILLLLLLFWGIALFCNCRTISAFTENELLNSSYMTLVENEEYSSNDRVVSDRDEIQRIASMLCDLKYIRKKSLCDSGGYSFIVELCDREGNKKRVEIFSEREVCINDKLYYLKRDQIDLRELRLLLY